MNGSSRHAVGWSPLDPLGINQSAYSLGRQIGGGQASWSPLDPLGSDQSANSLGQQLGGGKPASPNQPSEPTNYFPYIFFGVGVLGVIYYITKKG